MPAPRNRLRAFVNSFYDLQDLRLRTLGRAISADPKTIETNEDKKAPPPILTAEDVTLIESWGDRIEALEHEALRVIQKELKKHAVYVSWLADVDGIGPTMAAALLGGGIDIKHADTPSKIFKYVGIAPDSKRVRGQKSNYNPWLKTKLVGVLPDCIMKACVRKESATRKGEGWVLIDYPWITDEAGLPAKRWVKGPYAQAYFDYRNRWQSTIDVCRPCGGTGVTTKSADTDFRADADEAEIANAQIGAFMAGTEPSKIPAKPRKCWNCEGAGRGPKGNSDAHRHRAALRYLTKMVLIDLYKHWRAAEGLTVRPSYAEEFLGKAPHVGRQTSIEPAIVEKNLKEFPY